MPDNNNDDEYDDQGDVDDYDHRSLQTTLPLPAPKPRVPAPPAQAFILEEEPGRDVDEFDHRSVISTKYAIEQDVARANKTSAEKLAIKRKQDEIQRHAWE